MSRVNILKQLKVDGRWKLVSIPRDREGRYNWKALPDGKYFIEWWEHGKRKRRAAGATAAEAQEAARRRKHILEGRALGVEGYGASEDDAALRTPLHVSLRNIWTSSRASRSRTRSASIGPCSIAFWSTSPTARRLRASRPTT